jgi:hypothetical protein
LLLNDAITIYFSEPIQPTSVTEDSVTVIDENGHQVPGASLVVGTDWVSWVPEPPLAKDLSDGSFRPGGHYRLVLAGIPRVDRIRSRNGRSLDRRVAFDVFVAELSQVPAGLPAILRPSASDLPLLLRTSEVPQYVAADYPRLQVHFTLPVLPSSLTREDFRVRVLNGGVLVPRSVRVVTSSLDAPDFPGSTVEIDLGARPEFEDGTRRPLVEGDFISVKLVLGSGLVDYAGQPPLPSATSAAQFWSVVAGRRVPICEWPIDEQSFVSEDALRPGFEVRGSTIAPRVRVEAGNGSLGVFRPVGDMTLRPGETFDRGDGKLVASSGSEFHFSAIEVPKGVKVTVDATAGPVRLLSCGGVRIEGSVQLIGPTSPLPTHPFIAQPVQDLIDVVRVSIVAAGDLQVLGDIDSKAAISGSETALLLAAAGRLRLYGGLPFQSVLVVDARGGDSRIEGVRGQSRPYPASFEVGLAVGSDFEVQGVLPWRRLPAHLDSGQLQIGDQSGDLSIVWQSTSADAIRGELPDLTEGHVGSWQYARDRDVLVAGGGAFLRLRLTARARHGVPLPNLSGLRLVEN